MSRFTPLRLILATALTAAMALVAQPTVPATALDVYTEPGLHTFNGREWSTTCENYSSAVKRCRTEIWATYVTLEAGLYVSKTGWFFNNLTYLPAPRAQWVGNPLGETGEWTSTDGRQWKTECDTPATGRNGCRSYIFVTTIGVVSESPRTYGKINQWVFNNIVQFSVPPPPTPPPGPCNDATIPAGFKVSKVNGKLIPHAIKTPYQPNTLYNPTSISNFTRSVLRNTALKAENRVQWDCLLSLGTTALMDGSEVSQYNGKTVLWFPYMFEFDATPTDEIPPLQPGWKSGLAQGGALGLMSELATDTGDDSWLNLGEQVFNSFGVPLDQGGFTHRDDGFLWFEEYTTTPPTTVLNGHLEAVIGLDLWARRTGNQHARDLFNEAVVDLEGVLPHQEVDVEGGLLTSYDLVRGYPSAPLRLTKAAGASFSLASATLNGVTIPKPPVTAPEVPGQPNLLSWVMGVYTDGPAAVGVWRSIAPRATSRVTEANGTVKILTDRTSWQGIQQIVPRTSFQASKPLTMSVDAKLTLSSGAGLSPRVAVYQRCDVGGTSLLFETQKLRGRDWATYTMGFTAPPPNCDILVQLLTSSYGSTGTIVEYRNIELRAADVEGPSLKPGSYAINDLSVYETPMVVMSLTGTGTARLEAFQDGRWHVVGPVTLTAGTPVEIIVPERFSGRNLHYGYHETHVAELVSLYRRAYAAGFSADDSKFLRDYAVRWELFAPSQHGTIPPEHEAMARPMSAGPDLDRYELPLTDPFGLFMEE